MKRVLAIFGYGPGISNAIALKFGREGFSIALVSRTRERLEAAVAGLRREGIDAAAFIADAGNPKDIRRAVKEVRAQLGPVTAIEWTAYGSGGGDLITATEEELRAVLDVPILGLITAVQAALPDLRASETGAVLVTNGGLGMLDHGIDRVGVDRNLMGLSLANSAKHKLVRLLSHRLKTDGIYVGEIIVESTVKGSAFDKGSGTLEAGVIADKFWEMYSERSHHLARMS